MAARCCGPQLHCQQVLGCSRAANQRRETLQATPAGVTDGISCCFFPSCASASLYCCGAVRKLVSSAEVQFAISSHRMLHGLPEQLHRVAQPVSWHGLADPELVLAEPRPAHGSAAAPAAMAAAAGPGEERPSAQRPRRGCCQSCPLLTWSLRTPGCALAPRSAGWGGKADAGSAGAGARPVLHTGKERPHRHRGCLVLPPAHLAPWAAEGRVCGRAHREQRGPPPLPSSGPEPEGFPALAAGSTVPKGRASHTASPVDLLPGNDRNSCGASTI